MHYTAWPFAMPFICLYGNEELIMAVDLPFEEGDWVDSQTWSKA